VDGIDEPWLFFPDRMDAEAGYEGGQRRMDEHKLKTARADKTAHLKHCGQVFDRKKALCDRHVMNNIGAVYRGASRDGKMNLIPPLPEIAEIRQVKIHNMDGGRRAHQDLGHQACSSVRFSSAIFFLVDPLGVFLRQNNPERFNENLDVKEKRIILYVRQVQLDPFLRSRAVFPHNVSKAGNAGADLLPKLVFRQGLQIQVDEVLPLRPRTHKGHVPLLKRSKAAAARQGASGGATGRAL
jgi:hypothetical protein